MVRSERLAEGGTIFPPPRFARPREVGNLAYFGRSAYASSSFTTRPPWLSVSDASVPLRLKVTFA